MAQHQAIDHQDVNAALLTVQALDLRRAGASYREIARQLGCSHAVVYKYVSKALAEVRDEAHESAGELREIELERLDALYMRLQVKLQNQVRLVDGKQVPDPDEQTVRAMLDVMKRRAELVGLDAPKRQEIGGPDGGPIPVVVGDGRAILLSRLADIERRQAAVVVPDAAKEIESNPTLIAPGLGSTGAGVSHNGSNGNGQNGKKHGEIP